MFVGHFALGMAAKKIEPTVSLATLFVAAQFVDLLWPFLLLFNVEHVEIVPGLTEFNPLSFTHYPVSHSLVMAMVWSVLFGGIYYGVTRNKTGALVLGVLVTSHWFLDLVVHIPDLPLYPGESPKVGLGLWNSKLLTIVIELFIFAAGIVVYARSMKRASKKVNGRFWGLIVFFLIIYFMSIMGPPPPSESAIAWAGHLQWLFVLWAWWAERE